MAWSRLRLGVFCCVSVVLVAAALLLAQRSSSPRPTPDAAAVRSPASRTGRSVAASGPGFEDVVEDPALARTLADERLGVRSAARNFLGAYFRYELGYLSAPVRRRLRQYATPAFAAMLLVASPRPTAAGPVPAPARLASLEVTFLGTTSPPSALVQGTAIRDRRAEPLSFRFERGARGWLAAGVGQ